MSFLDLPYDCMLYIVEYFHKPLEILNYILLNHGIKKLIYAGNYNCNIIFTFTYYTLLKLSGRKTTIEISTNDSGYFSDDEICVIKHGDSALVENHKIILPKYVQIVKIYPKNKGRYQHSAAATAMNNIFNSYFNLNYIKTIITPCDFVNIFDKTKHNIVIIMNCEYMNRLSKAHDMDYQMANLVDKNNIFKEYYESFYSDQIKYIADVDGIGNHNSLQKKIEKWNNIKYCNNIKHDKYVVLNELEFNRYNNEIAVFSDFCRCCPVCESIEKYRFTLSHVNHIFHRSYIASRYNDIGLLHRILKILEYGKMMYTTNKYSLYLTQLKWFLTIRKSLLDSYVNEHLGKTRDMVLVSGKKYKLVKYEPNDTIINNLNYRTNYILRHIINRAKNNDIKIKGARIYLYMVGSTLINMLSMNWKNCDLTDIDIPFYVHPDDYLEIDDVLEFFVKEIMRKTKERPKLILKTRHKFIIDAKGVELEVYRIYRPIHEIIRNHPLSLQRIMWDFNTVYCYVSAAFDLQYGLISTANIHGNICK